MENYTTENFSINNVASISPSDAGMYAQLIELTYKDVKYHVVIEKMTLGSTRVTTNCPYFNDNKDDDKTKTDKILELVDAATKWLNND